ncbi:hypothetical protein BDZ85DRAFT_189478 [Elsinoe ampelina]|uniref:Uncharacterized protein n=1 Tax=Elsinoe ampelina TaxID=302913 RepID=A0A6A6GNU3_9PEZI|nr:hypothetical protein BDZ85DRAFT_189478 [Elsinoe ampelina]
MRVRHIVSALRTLQRESTTVTAQDLGAQRSEASSLLLPKTCEDIVQRSKSRPGLTHATETIQLTQGRYDRARLWANRNWVWEIAACMTSLLCLMAIVALLAAFDGRTAPHWPQLITLNSAIAVLTTLQKGTVLFVVSEGISQQKWTWFMDAQSLDDLSLFDSASRGPWGSLLFAIKGLPAYARPPLSNELHTDHVATRRSQDQS